MSLLRKLPFFVHAPTQNFCDLEKSAISRNIIGDETSEGPKKLSTNISALRPLQNAQVFYLHPHRTSY